MIHRIMITKASGDLAIVGFDDYNASRNDDGGHLCDDQYEDLG